MFADTTQVGGQEFTHRFYVWFAEYLFVVQVYLMDIHSALAPCSPTHIRVFDVKERLLWPLEQRHASAEPSSDEVLWPVRLLNLGFHFWLSAEKTR